MRPRAALDRPSSGTPSVRAAPRTLSALAAAVLSSSSVKGR
ncbi:hypothetical protein [Streptomyces sp. MUM 2J]|nr:hypothetical protein [Streptomyces sp. MUM 2J]